MTIAPDSASYPVLGAAIAAGVDYGLAMAWVEVAYPRGAANDEFDFDEEPIRWAAIKARHGDAAAVCLHKLLRAARRAGRFRT